MLFLFWRKFCVSTKYYGSTPQSKTVLAFEKNFQASLIITASEKASKDPMNLSDAGPNLRMIGSNWTKSIRESVEIRESVSQSVYRNMTEDIVLEGSVLH